MGIQERRQREKMRRSNEIIDAAEEVIFEKGINSATMDDIAQRAELSKATLYVYYANKDEILLAIQKRALDKLAQLFREAVKSHQRGLDQVRAIGKTYFNFAKEYPDYYHFISLFEAVDTKIDAEKSMEHTLKVNDVLVQAIQTGIADGSMRAELQPRVLAKSLWAMSTGLLQMLHLKGEVLEAYHDLKAEDFFEGFFDLVEYGMRT